MDTCPSPERLRAYRDGRLDAGAGAQIEDHLDACQACADEYGRLLGASRFHSRDGDAAPPRPLPLPAPLEEALRQLGLPPSARRTDGFAHQAPDGYTLLDVLGRGAVGFVYRALDLASRRVVALKMIASGEFPSPDESRRFHAEAEALSKLNEEALGVVRVFDHGVCPRSKQHFIAMQYVSGGSLLGRLAELSGAPRETARIVAEAAEAADRLHRQNFLHRDIKPGNILLQLSPAAAAELSPGAAAAPPLERFTPLLADLGLVKRIGASGDTSTGKILGTPGFLAPEMIRGSKDATVAADVYSLGATLYNCLTGVPPFQGATPFDTLKMVEGDYPAAPGRFNRQIPAPLQWICLKCLEKDPARRYGSAAALAADLRRFLKEDAADPVRARPPAWWLQAWRWSTVNPRKVLAAVAGAAVLLAVTAAALFQAHASTARRQAAERLTASEKQAAHAARVAAAREAARRGDWDRALPAYDRAIDDGAADTLRLRVERLVGFFALNQTEALTGELAALDQFPPGELTAQIKLMQGAWLLCDLSRQDRGQVLVREALADRQHLFSSADGAFAEALAAERTGQAIAALRRAVAADPLHYLATSSLVMLLAAVGDRDEVRRQAQFLHGIFPTSPMPDFAELIVSLIDGDRKSVMANLQRVGEKLPPQRRSAVARLEEFLTPLLELQEISRRLSGGDLRGLPRALVLLARVKHAGSVPSLGPLGLPVPIVPLLSRRVVRVLSAYLEVGPLIYVGLPVPAARARLEAINSDWPDAGTLLLLGIVRLRMAVVPLNRGEVGEALEHVRAAAELSSRAIQAPSMLPQPSTIPYLARGLAAVADLAVLKMARQPDPIHLRRLRASLPRMVSQGQTWPDLRQPLLALLVQIATTPLTPQQVVDWKLQDAAGRAAFRERMRTVATLSRALLDDWAIDAPDNPVIPRLHQDLIRWTATTGIDDGKRMPPARMKKGHSSYLPPRKPGTFPVASSYFYCARSRFSPGERGTLCNP